MSWLRRRRRRVRSSIIKAEWALHNYALERRLAEMERYYGPWGECEGMGV